MGKILCFAIISTLFLTFIYSIKNDQEINAIITIEIAAKPSVSEDNGNGTGITWVGMDF